MKALISVYNKQGIENLARVLQDLGYEIISSGGTARYLKERGITVKDVSEITGFPEIFGGRVKTLHPIVHGGILMREKDKEDAQRLGIDPIDVVVVNLYPFEEKMKDDLPLEELAEFIDIGGPALIRASAKNFFRVTVVVDPEDYGWVANKLKEGSFSLEDRAYLAWKAFCYTSYYDGLIAGFFQRSFDIEEVPKKASVPMALLRELRYGENPHQRGWLFKDPFDDLGVANAQVLQGKEMSFNNYLDAEAAARVVLEFLNDCVCTIVKHNNPCGVAVGNDPLEAFLKAKETDPEAAFGGIVAFNEEVDGKVAKELASMFLEVIVAPQYSEEALKILSKKKNLRLVRLLGLSFSKDIKKVSGGYLLQEEDTALTEELKVVTEREPTEREMEDLLFAWKVCKHVKSNAVVIAKDKRTLGIGSGQVSRVDSLRCAIEKAKRYGFDLKGAVLASEAFFPFRDSIDIAHEAGITAVIHPGGSIRDEEVISAAKEHGMAMVLTGMRHFRH